MAKKAANPKTPIIQDLRIELRSVDRSRKDLDKWRQALQSAENILRPTRKLLYDLYADIVLDDHLRSVMDQRRLAITNTTLVFQHDGQEVPELTDLINSAQFEELLTHIIDAKFYGYSLVYFNAITKEVALVPRAHVNPVHGYVSANPYDDHGIQYGLPPYTHYYLGAGHPDDLGLILLATPLVLIKRGDLSDWASFNEIFGQPTRVGRYDPNMPGQREQLTTALREAGAMAYLAIPTGAEVDFIEANKSGASETYNTLYQAMEQAISKLIVGQTMTTEDGSSLAQANVHMAIAGRIAQADRRYVLRYLNTRFREMLIAQGVSVPTSGVFQFVEEEENISKMDRLNMDLLIHQHVARLPIEYFAEEYNVPLSAEAPAVEPTANKPDPTELTLSLPDDFFD